MSLWTAEVRILVVKVGAIGDVVQLAVGLQHYKECYPEHTVDWLTSADLSEFVKSLGVAKCVLSIDDKILVGGSLQSRLISLIKINASLFFKYLSYDRIVTAYSDWRYRLLTASVFWKPHLTFVRYGIRPNPIQHRNRIFEYWRLLSGDDASSFDIVDCSQNIGNKILSKPISSFSQEKFDSLPNRYVVLIPGGARNLLRSDDLRRWPLDNYRKLAEKILKSGRHVVLAGGITDHWVRAAFNDIPCVDFIGLTSLSEMVHILNRSEAIVSHDTGPLHLAMITKAPLICLFGPTPANAIVSIGRPKTVVLQMGNKVACSPCYDGKNYAMCNIQQCMIEISVDNVFRELCKFLDKCSFG